MLKTRLMFLCLGCGLVLTSLGCCGTGCGRGYARSSGCETCGGCEDECSSCGGSGHGPIYGHRGCNECESCGECGRSCGSCDSCNKGCFNFHPFRWVGRLFWVGNWCGSSCGGGCGESSCNGSSGCDHCGNEGEPAHEGCASCNRGMAHRDSGRSIYSDSNDVSDEQAASPTPAPRQPHKASQRTAYGYQR